MTRYLGIAAAAALVFFPSYEAHAQEQASRELISFVWASGIDGRGGVGDRVGDLDTSFDELIDFVDVGASLRYRSARDRYGWYLEGTYVRLSDSVDAVPEITEVEFTRRLGEIGFSRDFNPGLTGYLGLRAQQLDTDLRIVDGRVFDADTSWVDGVVGLRWTPVRSPTWTAWLRGDVGAGGSDSVWLAEAGGGYRFGARWTGYLAYRVLSTDYEGGGIVYDVDESGLAFGFGLSF